MTVVVDASVAVKWFLGDEPDAERAFALLNNEDDIIAPDLLVAEVCNAGWRSARLGRILEPELNEIAARVPRLFGELVSSAALAERATSIAWRIDHPVYDCLYLSLAEARQIPLITADARLLAKMRDTPWAARVQALVDYRPEA